ncbi:hypothetical protein [Mucilaginibacter myungsuensis]|uniref:Uncharacterized protein n=1 Tax=Mucilaginibacter myungsuensis TaxID=649104 RepID=A0A929L0I8_9SPHI|nr:hypothetical protein [Mucilaginibacter myungsuensis]MBE9663353.1 hypothetical protein [Mucilaginibacter myungsuensis]MDN3600088.1 hypothetical protein [Mucilaginibacter myungsuensis]
MPHKPPVRLLVQLTFNPDAAACFRFPIENIVRASVYFAEPRYSAPSEVQVTKPISIDVAVKLEIHIAAVDHFIGEYYSGNTFYLLGYGKKIATATIVEVIKQ